MPRSKDNASANASRNIYAYKRRIPMNLKYCVLCMASALVITSTAAAQQTTSNEVVINLNLPGGTHQRVLYTAPMHPQATLVMLPGAGELGLHRDGDIRH